MAISEPEIPSTQHFQVCDNEECKKLSILRQSVSSSNVRTKQRKSSQESGILES